VARITTSSLPGALVALALFLPGAARAQELEPGAYWPIPAALNIATFIYGFNAGDVAFDQSGPIDEASARINTIALVFTRAFSLAGRSANLGVMLPVFGGDLEGRYLGEPADLSRFGQGDPRLRLGVNLYGAPAMTPRDFAAYRGRTLVGLSLAVALPLGQYDSARLINIGTNRWSFKPELGLTRVYGKWVLEAMVGAWLFTDNTDFFGGRTREQDPIAQAQVHLTYRFRPSVWLAADANFYTGGRTTVDGRANFDLQRNSRIGATFSAALDRRQAIRASVSRGAYTTIGADFTSVAVGYSYAWVR
jgi:hypothetical protein